MDPRIATKKITVYGAEWCAFCHMVKRYLDDKNVKYAYIDVDHDKDAAKHIVERTGQAGIPVTEIGNEVIIGFDRPKIDAALSELK